MHYSHTKSFRKLREIKKITDIVRKVEQYNECI